MSYLFICAAALLASGLTLFSGFGLGTLLMPVFAIFFPVEVAIAQTALVHLANNLFKVGLFGRRADWPTVLRFGLPAFLASFAGARLLFWLADLAPLATWSLSGRYFLILPVKLVVALLMAAFATLELRPATRQVGVSQRFLAVGGMLSGFFGGLSGNQGAFRSAFLIRSGLGKDAFVGSGVVIAALVDFSRLTVYARLLASEEVRADLGLIVAAILAAFLGAFAGSRLLRKVTLRFLQLLVAGMLFLIALLLGSGII